MKQFPERILPHLCIALSLAALALCVVDAINSQMGFLASTGGRALLIAANALSVLFCAYKTLR